jgi:hypothetical protein
MTFDVSNLSALSYANGFTQWHYRTTDKMHQVQGVGYFDNASMICRNDQIIVNLVQGEYPAPPNQSFIGFFSTNGKGNLVVDVY